MSEWLSVETAPKDGRVIRLKRVFEGRIVSEGLGVFAIRHENSPARNPLPPDPLGRLELLGMGILENIDEPRWLQTDRMNLFPEPTHWKPESDNEAQ